ncbi:MAG TPA: hypothetical protein DCZ61_06860 [Lachnospiraceae bacterium]|nr:hypothetical protein [Lachnospiraceae bacterium]
MNNTLANIREQAQELYANYDVYIRPLLKFALALIIFMSINNELGYLTILNSLFVIVILAVICSILPINGTVVIGVLLIVAHCFGLGVEVGGFALIIYLIMIILYFRFNSRDSLILLLTPVAFRLHMPAAVPIGAGLLRGPLSTISVVCGLISYEFIYVVKTDIEPMKNAASGTSNLLDVLEAMPQKLLSQEIIMQLITFVVVMLAVMVIRRLITVYSWETAIAVGTILYLFLNIAGSFILGTKTDIVMLVAGAVLSLAVCLVLKLFFYFPDYAGSEYLEFEDDKYYYKVKVIPKVLPRKKVFREDEDAEEGEGEEDSFLDDDTQEMEDDGLTGEDRHFGAVRGPEAEKTIRMPSEEQIESWISRENREKTEEKKPDIGGETIQLTEIHKKPREEETIDQFRERLEASMKAQKRKTASSDKNQEDSGRD